MIDIRIFRKPSTVPVDRLLITYKAKEIRYTRRFYERGEFSLLIPTRELQGAQIDCDDIVQLGGDFCGIIDEAPARADGSGDFTTLSGYDLGSLLDWRETVPINYTSTDGTAGYDARTGASETIIKGFVAANLSNPPQAKRRVPNFTIATDQGRGIANDKYMSRFESLHDVVSKIAKDAKLGWRVNPVISDGQPFGYLFDCFLGLDRTADQTENPPAIFEIERGSVMSIEYGNSTRSYKNAFYTTKSGSTFASDALTLLYWRDAQDEPQGFDRREKWLNVSVGNVPVGQEYSEMRRQALLQTKNYERVRSLTANVNNSKLVYGVDYNLGNIVTIRHKGWGVTLHAQITEITCEYAGDAFNIYATFGDKAPNALRLINNTMKELR